MGSYLLPKLIDRKHKVYALTRTIEKIQKINELGATGLLGDIRDPGSFINQLKGIELIILLAMPGVIPGRRINRKHKEELRKETNDIFNNSMDMAVHYQVPIILPSGTSYQTGNDETADETWRISRIGLAEIGKDTDIMVQKAIRTGIPGIIQSIYGRIYGNGGLFRIMYEMMNKGNYRIIGNGENFIPNIYAGDAAMAIMRAIEKMPVGEKFIIADNTPVTQKDFAYHMAAVMNKRKPGKIPGFLIKMFLGKDMYEVITMNCKVSNIKARNMLGWDPEYPSFREGLEITINEMDETLPYFTPRNFT